MAGEWIAVAVSTFSLHSPGRFGKASLPWRPDASEKRPCHGAGLDVYKDQPPKALAGNPIFPGQTDHTKRELSKLTRCVCPLFLVFREGRGEASQGKDA